MEKKSVGKYVLVFEPKYAYHQFAVYFNNNEVDVTAIKKYTDLPLKGQKGVVKKNTLADIDRILTPLEDEKEFFDKYVDPSIFRFSYGSLHKMFIAYKQNQQIYTLNCEFDNKSLNKKLDLVTGSKINDFNGISQLINFATDTSEQNRFLQFAEKSRQDHKTGISTQTLTLLNRMKIFKKMAQTDQFTGFECLEEQTYLDEILTRNLTGYKEYRELFLLRSAYGDAIEKEKIKLECMKQEIISKSNKRAAQEQPEEYVQLSLFDQGYQKIK